MSRDGRIWRLWSAEDDAFMLEHYRTLGARACAEHLGRSQTTIHQRATRLGLSRPQGEAAIGRKRERREAKQQPKPPALVASPSVTESDFIRPPTKARLMGGRA